MARLPFRFHLLFRAHLPLSAIAVRGSSMSPTYNDGDWLLFWKFALDDANNSHHLVGKVVVIERESYPGVLFIKRVVKVDQAGIWVIGDNQSASTDSRQWGSLAAPEIRGRVLLRYKRSRFVKP